MLTIPFPYQYFEIIFLLFLSYFPVLEAFVLNDLIYL